MGQNTKIAIAFAAGVGAVFAVKFARELWMQRTVSGSSTPATTTS